MNKLWITVISALVLVTVLALGITFGVRYKNQTSEVNPPKELKDAILGDENNNTPEGVNAPASVARTEAGPQVPAIPTVRTLPQQDLSDVEILEKLTPEQLQLILPPEPQSVFEESVAAPEGRTTNLQGAPDTQPLVPELPKPAVFRGHPDVKVYTLENDLAKANDVAKVDVAAGADTFVYKFKPGAECVEVKFRNKSLWLHDANAHGNNYPRELSYYAGFDMFYVHMNETWTYTYAFKNGEWALFRTNLNGRPAKLTPPTKTTFTYEPEEPSPVTAETTTPRGREVKEQAGITITSCKNLGDGKVNNMSDYRVYEYGDKLTFHFENGSKCLKVEHNNLVAWRHDINEHTNNFPRFVEFNKNTMYLEVNFNNEWYYGYTFRGGRWELNNKKLVMKPGELPPLLKEVFNIDLSLSPSLLLYFSGMSIRTIRFLSNFYPSIDACLRQLIDKLYNSELYWETLPSIITNPDHLPKLLEMIKGTSLSVDEARLNNLIAKPNLLLHLIKELKAVGFTVDELLKKLLADPEKLKVLLAKLKELGYALNETQIKKLAENTDLLAYLKVQPKGAAAGAGVGGAGPAATAVTTPA